MTLSSEFLRMIDNSDENTIRGYVEELFSGLHLDTQLDITGLIASAPKDGSARIMISALVLGRRLERGKFGRTTERNEGSREVL